MTAPNPLPGSRQKRPAHIPPLSASLFTGGPGGASPHSATGAGAGPGGRGILSPTTPNGERHGTTRPASVCVVVNRSSGVKAVDGLAGAWKKDGFGARAEAEAGEKGKKAELVALVYELAMGEGVDKADGLSVASGAPDHLPLSLIQPLSTLPPTLPESAPGAPVHLTLSYSLPTLTDVSVLKGTRELWSLWLSTFRTASEKQLAIELRLARPGVEPEPEHAPRFGGVDAPGKEGEASALDTKTEKTREAVEELLGKAFEEDIKSAGENGDVIQNGARIVLDNFGSPPMHLPSTQLLHSVSLRNYVGFISRLALHPRTYLKLSPLEAASAFSLAPSTSAADASRLPGANSLPASALGTAQAALDATKVAASTAASAVGDAAARATGRTEPSEEHRAELKRRLRVFLDAALDAFGEDRIFWAANVPAGGAGAGATTDEGEETLSEPEKWFELVRESLADLGLEQAALDKIFASNARKVYRV